MKKIVMFAMLSVAMNSYAAGFNCELASTKVEHAICDNPVVSQLDEDLNNAYKSAVRVSPNLKQEQREWVRDVRNTTPDLETAYRERLGYLNEIVNNQEVVKPQVRTVKPVGNGVVTGKLKELGNTLGMFKPCVDQYQMTQDNYDYMKREVIADAKKKYGSQYNAKTVKAGYDVGLNNVMILSNADPISFAQMCSVMNDKINNEIEKSSTTAEDFE